MGAGGKGCLVPTRLRPHRTDGQGSGLGCDGAGHFGDGVQTVDSAATGGNKVVTFTGAERLGAFELVRRAGHTTR